MEWRLIETGKACAEKIMALDAMLLEQAVSEPHPLLHLYSWEVPSATYGYFIDPYQFLNREGVQKQNLKLARRPTGGGIVFHLTDFAFSIIIPASHPGYSLNILDNYLFVNRLIQKVVCQFLNEKIESDLLPHEPSYSEPISRNFCMAKPTKYDVMLNERKVGGGAQRRTRHAFLHQGTIAVGFPREEFLETVLLPDSCVLENMRRHSYSLLPVPYSERQLEEARQEIKALLTNVCVQS